jgi:hypothetical protein
VLTAHSPEDFFKTHTLTSPTAKKWLSSHLSAAEALNNGHPSIWLLTGLILMSHATWTLLSSSERFIPGERAPFNPHSVSAIRRTSVSEGVKPTFGYRENGKEKEKVLPGGSVILETGKYPGTRVWAAQWVRVEVELLDGEKWEGKGDIVRLRRFDENGSKVARLGMVEDEFALNGEEKEEEFDEGFWDRFLDATDE